MANTTLTDGQLKEGIKNRRERGDSKLKIVKYVWDYSDKNLRDSKEFVDNF